MQADDITVYYSFDGAQAGGLAEQGSLSLINIREHADDSAHLIQEIQFLGGLTQIEAQSSGCPDLSEIGLTTTKINTVQQQLSARMQEISSLIHMGKHNQKRIAQEIQLLDKKALQVNPVKETLLMKRLADSNQHLNESLAKLQQLLLKTVQGQQVGQTSTTNLVLPAPAVSQQDIHSVRRPVETPSHQITQLLQFQNYKSKPYFVIYKRCVLSSRTQIYKTPQCVVLFSKTAAGIQLDLTSNANLGLRIHSKDEPATSLLVDWSMFQNQVYVRDCELVNSSRSTQATIPVPLPINMLFQKRLTTQSTNVRHKKIKAFLPLSHELVIQHFDKTVLSAVHQNPDLLCMEKTGGQLTGLFSIRGTRYLYLVEARMAQNQLHVCVWYKSSSFLTHLLEFYSFLFNQ